MARIGQGQWLGLGQNNGWLGPGQWLGLGAGQWLRLEGWSMAMAWVKAWSVARGQWLDHMMPSIFVALSDLVGRDLSARSSLSRLD